jgi:DNA-binding phage protein
MSRKAKFDHTGSSFDDFLEAEGIREEVEAAAIKAVIAADLQRTMIERKISKSALARQLATSRAHVDRLLDPHYTPVSLETISRAATFMGKRLHFSLRDAAPIAARTAKPKTSVTRTARRKAAV